MISFLRGCVLAFFLSGRSTKFSLQIVLLLLQLYMIVTGQLKKDETPLCFYEKDFKISQVILAGNLNDLRSISQTLIR